MSYERNKGGQAIPFDMMSAVDASARLPGLTVTIGWQKDAGDEAVGAGTVEQAPAGSGAYRYLPTKAEMDCAGGKLTATAPGAAVTSINFATVSYSQDQGNQSITLGNTDTTAPEVLTGFTGTAGSIPDTELKGDGNERSITSGGSTGQHAEYVFQMDQPNILRVPRQIFFYGRMEPQGGAQGRYYRVEVWNTIDAAWRNIDGMTQRVVGVAVGQANNRQYIYNITEEEIDPTNGIVRMRFTSDGGVAATGDIIYIDELRCVDSGRTSPAQPSSDFYPLEQVYVDTVNGVPGAIPNVTGTVSNPCALLSDAIIVAQALGYYKLEIKPGSTVDINQDVAGYDISGKSYNASFTGNPSAQGAKFRGGIYTGTYAGIAEFEHCYITGPFSVNGIFSDCKFTNQSSVLGDSLLENCVGLSLASFDGQQTARVLTISDFTGNATLRNWTGGTIQLQGSSGVFTLDTVFASGVNLEIAGGAHIDDPNGYRGTSALVITDKAQTVYQRWYDRIEPGLDNNTRETLEIRSARFLQGKETPSSTSSTRQYEKLDGSGEVGAQTTGTNRRETVTFP